MIERVLASLLGGILLAVSQPSDSSEIAKGRLRPCPSSPNCVSSQASDEAHRVEPLRFQGDPGAVLERLRRAVVSLPRAVVVTHGDGYLHAEFTSLIFRFVDDLELLVDAEHQLIHVRSASRLGYSDLGANRRRVEALRAAFEQTDSV